MAITKTTTLDQIELNKPFDPSAADTTNDHHWRISALFTDVLDDTSDVDLPVTVSRTKHYLKYDAEGNATDMSNEAQVLQDVSAALWS